MGLFDFLRGKDERAIPEPGTPEFEAAVKGSAIPDSQSVEMGESGWASADAAKQAVERLGADPSQVQLQHSSETIDLQDAAQARERIIDTLRRHGVDPDKPGQRVHADSVPGLRDAILGALGEAGIQIPRAGGFGGGVSSAPQDPLAVVEQLAKQRDAGVITEAEFEAQKKRILGS